ncbi:hypothetical protein [Avibacterium paragallinarum]|uniref:hypothetical protein n=1 Tax=Avibacterium paragallinarum TaxID=728 RepID=UPI003D70D8C6
MGRQQNKAVTRQTVNGTGNNQVIIKQYINITVDTPFLPVSEYAKRIGKTEKVVRDLVQAGRLPVIERQSEKGRIYINMIALAREAARQQ